MEQKFYRCNRCGNIITHLVKSGANVMCCGEPMQELIPNTSDGAGEKHVPVIQKEGTRVTVRVGSVEHPSLDNHYIMFIVLQTKNGIQVHHLKPGDAPAATFALPDGDETIAAYEYCNLHGLWKAEV